MRQGGLVSRSLTRDRPNEVKVDWPPPDSPIRACFLAQGGPPRKGSAIGSYQYQTPQGASEGSGSFSYWGVVVPGHMESHHMPKGA
jgi:hypothetical protein